MSIISGGSVTGAAAAYQIERSLRFNSADSAYLNRTFGTPTSANKWTLSLWLKRAKLGTPDNGIMHAGATSVSHYFEFTTGDALQFVDGGGFTTSKVYRDTSAWYHIVLAVDAAASGTNKVRVYTNGVEETAFSSDSRSTWTGGFFNAASTAHYLGLAFSTSYVFDGYMTEVNFVDGQQLTPSSFGETDSNTGVWKPKKFSGTYGTNGFYLNFSDNSNTTSTTLGKDSSGNGNNWTPNNFSVTAGAGNDSLVDTPTNYGTDTGLGAECRGNYATQNALVQTSNLSLSNGNLTITGSGSYSTTPATLGMSSGKWYWEYTCTTYSASGDTHYGIGTGAFNLYQNTWAGNTAAGWVYVASNGSKYNNGTSGSYGASFTSGDIIGVAFDADAGTLTFYKNGATQGTAYTGLTSGPYFPIATVGTSNVTNANFGQRPFAYTAPSGFRSICTQNLPPVTIGATSTTQAGKYMNVALYTGNGGTAQNITGVGFQPDWVWIKSRNSASFSHRLYDAVRGAGKEIYSNDTAAESNVAQSLTAFISDGFSLGTDLNNNQTSTTYAAWNWKANGAGSSNTAGSITSTVSASTTSGFSIVTYTGTGSAGTIGHGLGAAPQMIIVKNRNTSSYGWFVWHTAFGAASNTDYINLNLTDAKGSGGAVSMWNTTMPTSSVFSVGTYGGVNGNTNTYVAYCFAPVAGYSAFGSYTGNGSTDGPFVYLGFRPRWVMIKASSTGGAGYDWFIYDTARDTYNVCTKDLEANLSLAEDGYSADIDVTSNGFKLRNGNGGTNGSSVTYIYMAFAENPFKYSLAR
jgi:hypothetical protein